jgi:hypothetical protein
VLLCDICLLLVYFVVSDFHINSIWNSHFVVKNEGIVDNFASGESGSPGNWTIS